MVQKDELPLCNQVYVQFVYGGKENSFPSVCGSSLICHEEREKKQDVLAKKCLQECYGE